MYYFLIAKTVDIANFLLKSYKTTRGAREGAFLSISICLHLHIFLRNAICSFGTRSGIQKDCKGLGSCAIIKPSDLAL